MHLISDHAVLARHSSWLSKLVANFICKFRAICRTIMLLVEALVIIKLKVWSCSSWYAAIDRWILLNKSTLYCSAGVMKASIDFTCDTASSSTRVRHELLVDVLQQRHWRHAGIQHDTCIHSVYVICRRPSIIT